MDKEKIQFGKILPELLAGAEGNEKKIGVKNSGVIRGIREMRERLGTFAKTFDVCLTAALLGGTGTALAAEGAFNPALGNQEAQASTAPDVLEVNKEKIRGIVHSEKVGDYYNYKTAEDNGNGTEDSEYTDGNETDPLATEKRDILEAMEALPNHNFTVLLENTENKKTETVIPLPEGINPNEIVAVYVKYQGQIVDIEKELLDLTKYPKILEIGDKKIFIREINIPLAVELIPVNKDNQPLAKETVNFTKDPFVKLTDNSTINNLDPNLNFDNVLVSDTNSATTKVPLKELLDGCFVFNSKTGSVTFASLAKVLAQLKGTNFEKSTKLTVTGFFDASGNELPRIDLVLPCPPDTIATSIPGKENFLQNISSLSGVSVFDSETGEWVPIEETNLDDTLFDDTETGQVGVDPDKLALWALNGEESNFILRQNLGEPEDGKETDIDTGQSAIFETLKFVGSEVIDPADPRIFENVYLLDQDGNTTLLTEEGKSWSSIAMLFETANLEKEDENTTTFFIVGTDRDTGEKVYSVLPAESKDNFGIQFEKPTIQEKGADYIKISYPCPQGFDPNLFDFWVKVDSEKAGTEYRKFDDFLSDFVYANGIPPYLKFKIGGLGNGIPYNFQFIIRPKSTEGDNGNNTENNALQIAISDRIEVTTRSGFVTASVSTIPPEPNPDPPPPPPKPAPSC